MDDVICTWCGAVIEEHWTSEVGTDWLADGGAMCIDSPASLHGPDEN